MTTNTEAILFMNALIANMDIGVITYDMKGYITLINGKAISMLGLEGRPSMYIDKELMPLVGIPSLADHIKKCLTKSRRNFHLNDVQHLDRFLNIDGKKLLDGMVLSMHDITENVLAKDEATQSLLLGQEMERRRLAKEIHDGVGPNMSTLKLQIDAVKKKTQSNSVMEGLEHISAAISSIATDIRQISHDLMPSSLIDFGVVTALSNFAKKITNSSEIEVDFQANVKDIELSKEYSLNIYRIIQELVNNAIKHAQCSQIDISLRKDDHTINILVQDDGIGIDDSSETDGIGISNICTRVQSLHGDIEIDSSLGNGVTVHVTMPLLPLEINLKS